MRRFLRVLKWLTVGVALLAAAVGGFAAWHWQSDRPVAALAERWAQPPSDFIALEGMRVHYRDEGPANDPEPILLLHGTSDSLHAWDGWTAALTPTRRVIRLDLPGFGLTGPPDDFDLTTERYMAVLTGLLDARGVARAVVAGNSFGGRLAWTLALRAPERVSRLILIAPSGVAAEPTEVPAGFALAGMPGVREAMRHVLPRFLIRMSLESVYGDPSRVTEAEVDRFFEITLREGNRDALIGRYRMSDAAPDAARLGEVAQPTLLIWGAEDRLIPPSAADRFAQVMPNAEAAVLPGLGHVPMTEDPAATVAAAKAFLARPAP